MFKLHCTGKIKIKTRESARERQRESERERGREMVRVKQIKTTHSFILILKC